MRSISLFSGCGGFDFALRSLGVDTIWANDILSCAQETFKTYFSETHFCHADLSQVSEFPEVDIVTGGYPCQSFSMGGNRSPKEDERSKLYLEFARVVNRVQPKYFVAENVSGLKSVENGAWFKKQLNTFRTLGTCGYRVSHALVDAKDFGVPQNRRRILLVGVRKDLGVEFNFPRPTHGDDHLLLPYSSHGKAIAHLPLDAKGEYYERKDDPTGNFSWYYMSRNRKAAWHAPSYTVVANLRHVTLHPCSPRMKLLSSNLADGYKQVWDFSTEFEHLDFDPVLPVLAKPRRLSWREAAAIQTFPKDFEPAGNLQQKYLQIGNAVPPLLIKSILRGLIDGSGLTPA